MEQEILKAISEAVGQRVNRGNSFRYLGIDNLSKRKQLVNAINKKFNISIRNVKAFHVNTVAEFIDCITPMIVAHSYSLTKGDSSNVSVISDGNTHTESHAVSVGGSTSNNNKAATMGYKKKYEWAIAPDKNKHQYVIGIDFGHGETSAAYCPIGWDAAKGQLGNVKDIDFGSNTKVIPSAISITTDDKAYIGEAAFLPEVLSKAKANVCFKKKPEDINGEAEQLMMRFMKEVYATIRERNSALVSAGTADCTGSEGRTDSAGCT